jgi:nucleoside-diphosphate-sugar epimerase/UDP-N-acetylglucosamine transferase subunit ALG13
MDKFAMESGERVFVQLGSTPFKPIHCEYVRFIKKDRLMEKIQAAEMVICQGGFGSIRDALAAGKPVIAVPRKPELGESPDIQEELVRELEAAGRVLAVYDIGTLFSTIEKAKSFLPRSGCQSQIPELIGAFLDGSLPRPPISFWDPAPSAPPLRDPALTGSWRVLVTGGSGFIGTHLVESFLTDGIEVVNLDNSKPILEQHSPYWTNINLLERSRVSEFVRQFQPTHVVHLAARTDLDDRADLQGYAVNTTGVENVLRAVGETPSVKRLIVASSMLVCRLGYHPSAPDDYSTSTVYGQSKVLTETITRSAGIPCVWTIVRPATIWGPYHEGMKRGFFSVLQRGYYIHPGKASCLKSYGYVGNSVYQIRKILEAPQEQVNQQTLYIADPPINLRDWVGIFSEKLVGRNVRTVPKWVMHCGALVGDIALKFGARSFPITSFRLCNMTTENIVDIAPLLAITGQLPFTVSKGIDATVSWLRDVC